MQAQELVSSKPENMIGPRRAGSGSRTRESSPNTLHITGSAIPLCSSTTSHDRRVLGCGQLNADRDAVDADCVFTVAAAGQQTRR
jgi:hypothetical protein